MFREQRERKQQEVVEVHGVGLAEPRAEARIDLRRHTLERAVGARAQLLREHHAVLRARNDGVDRARGIRLGGVPALLQQALDEGLGVVLIVDREVRPEAQQGGLAPQQARGQRVEGPDPQAARVGAEQRGHARAHLSRRLVRERDSEDPRWRHATLADEMRDPGREDARLARPRAGEHQERAAGMADGGILLGIEREGHVALTSGNSSTNSAPSPVGAGRYTKRPPCCCSTMRRAKAKPMPHPPGLVETPGSNSWARTSSGTPGPSSITLSRAVRAAASTATSIRPPRPESASIAFLITASRSEEHTFELQSHSDLVCRLLLEKKKKKTHTDA